jgi:pimeloyl-ACP methyl ester carboxylesterase
MKQIVFVHGLNSSHRSFGYIVNKLPQHSPIMVDYLSHQPLSVSIEQVRAQLPAGELILVGHSLGGVIATLVAADEPERITKLVTISSPLNGSRAAAALRWIPGSLAVLGDIIPRGPHVRRCCDLMLTTPTLSIISTGGHLPTSPEPNDSVVAVSSQRALKFGKKVEVKANHFEVLLHEHTVGAIKNFIFEDNQ